MEPPQAPRHQGEKVSGLMNTSGGREGCAPRGSMEVSFPVSPSYPALRNSAVWLFLSCILYPKPNNSEQSVFLSSVSSFIESEKGVIGILHFQAIGWSKVPESQTCDWHL